MDAWAQIWGMPALPEQVAITFTRRLKRSLGRCNPEDRRVRVNARLLDGPPDLLREVLCHELAHVAVHLLHGRSVRPHGAEWARLMRLAGYEPRARMHAADLPDSIRTASAAGLRYLHRCPVCDAQREARRRCARWRCRRCRESGLDGRLEITTRPI